MKCPKCGSRDIDFQESIGQSICVNCGTVLEENTIVSSIEFQVRLTILLVGIDCVLEYTSLNIDNVCFI